MKRKLILILSILGIFILLGLAIFLKESPIAQGKINSINFKTNSVSIYLDNNSTEIVLFTNKVLNLKKEDEVQIYGKQEVYRNKTQIIAEKIVKLN